MKAEFLTKSQIHTMHYEEKHLMHIC